MKPEEFEVYVIPPNFMEGGTLFGGLLKTRNTIEAVILALAVGVPVLHLPFSLTVRVVILCLTALPLVLLALIGVSGMSLSAFIRLFFCFLHNRRILSRDGTQGGKNGKTLLPSWAQQRKSNCEAEDPPLPKSRSRFSVDLKQRSVTQFKTFLQEEEAVQPLNALADYIPIEKIEHGVIYTRNHRYYSVGDRVLVRVLTIDRDDINHISITADIRSVSSAANQSNLDKCVLQGKYAGRVTDVRHGVVFIRLNNGVNAVAHTCYDRRMPGKKDDVSFAVTRLDEERGIAVGIITRIIKQNL